MNALKWKKTCEELPKEFSKVLFFCELSGKIEVGLYRKEAFKYERIICSEESKEEVKYWLYFPSSPHINKNH